MKNRLYYILFATYFAMVGVILYINGVFTNEVSYLSDLMINIIFLIIIGIMFMISTMSFIRLNHCTDALLLVTDNIYKAYDSGNRKLWEEYSKKKRPFGNDVLDEAFTRYQKRMRSFQTKRGLSGTCDIEDYINEDVLNHVGMSYYNSAIPGTMTGLGILGTFIGLSIGLASFDGNDIYTISDNVGPLLGGMKVAFHTSVYGIFFSLVFTFVHRCIVDDANGKLREFLDCYEECVAPVVTSSDDNTKAMLVYQANMTNYLKQMTEMLKGNALEQTQGVERIVQTFTARLEQSMGTDFARLGRTLEKACDAQEVYTGNYKSMEESTKALLSASLTLQKTLEVTMERQEALSRELKAQAAKIDETCAAIENEISSQLYTFEQMKDMK